MPTKIRARREKRKRERDKRKEKEEDRKHQTNMPKNERARRERHRLLAREKRAEMKQLQEQERTRKESRKSLQSRLTQDITYMQLISKKKDVIIGPFRCKICKGKAFCSFERYHYHLSTHRRWTIGSKLRCKYRFNRTPEVIVMKVVKNMKVKRKSSRMLHRFGLKNREHFFRPSSDGKYDVHFANVNIKCSKCSNIFDSPEAFQKHAVDAHPGVDLHLCSLCGAAFEDETSLRIHERTHAESALKCTKCVDVFSSVARLEQHMKACHKNACDEATESRKIKLENQTNHQMENYKCEICSKEFQTNKQLYGHLSAHKRVKTNQPTGASVQKDHEDLTLKTASRQDNKKQTKEESILSCTKCGKIFKTRKGFKGHRCPFVQQCSKCDEHFDDKVLLDAHTIFHNGDNLQYECSPCGKSFPDLGRLITHALKSKSHSDPEKCLQCGKTLKSRKLIKQHLMMTHYKSQIFRCPKCSMNFLNMQAVKLHMTCHQPDEKNHDVSLKEAKVVSVKKEPISDGKYKTGRPSSTLFIHQCKHCNRKFRDEIMLKAHEVYHEKGDIEYDCPPCGKSFPDLMQLQQHVMNDKDHKNPLTCPKCGKTYKVRKSIRDHIFSHFKQKLFTCDLCGKSFTHRTTLRAHKDWHTGRFKCETCGKHASSQHELTQHQLKHTKEPLFTCKTCGRGFKYKKSLLTHPDCSSTEGSALKAKLKHQRKQRQQRRSFPCSVCDKIFRNNYELKLHMKAKHDGENMENKVRFPCKQCDKTYSAKRTLNEHVLYAHSDTDLEILKPHVCSECGRRCRTRVELKSHIMVHSDARPHECPTCKQAFKCKSALRVHVKAKHTKVRPHKCRFCYKEFVGSYTRKVHERSHMQIKLHMCDRCGNKFVKPSSLAAHIRLHTGELPFKCTDCDEHFRTKNGQHLHFNRVHLKDNPNVCHICGKVEATPGLLKIHLCYHTKPYICQYCGKNFGSSSAVKDHEKLHRNMPSRWSKGAKKNKKKEKETCDEQTKKKKQGHKEKVKKSRRKKSKKDGLAHDQSEYAKVSSVSGTGMHVHPHPSNYVIWGSNHNSTQPREFLEAINQDLKKAVDLNEASAVQDVRRSSCIKKAECGAFDLSQHSAPHYSDSKLSAVKLETLQNVIVEDVMSSSWEDVGETSLAHSVMSMLQFK